MSAPHELPPPLYFALQNSLTPAWQTTQQLRASVSRRGARPALSDVAATLRRLRRDGLADRQSRGTDGHDWRRAE